MCVSGGGSWLHGAWSYSPEIRSSSRVWQRDLPEKVPREEVMKVKQNESESKREGKGREEERKKEKS